MEFFFLALHVLTLHASIHLDTIYYVALSWGVGVFWSFSSLLGLVAPGAMLMQPIRHGFLVRCIIAF